MIVFIVLVVVILFTPFLFGCFWVGALLFGAMGKAAFTWNPGKPNPPSTPGHTPRRGYEPYPVKR